MPVEPVPPWKQFAEIAQLKRRLSLGETPNREQLRALIRHEMAHGKTLDSDALVALAAAILDDVHAFREAVRRNWQRNYDAQLDGASIYELGGRPSNEGSAEVLVICASGIASCLPVPLSTQVVKRLEAYALTFG